MTMLIVQHLLLAGAGVGALFVVAFALRLLARLDAVLRYRLMVAGLLAALAILPLQALVAEASGRPAARNAPDRAERTSIADAPYRLTEPRSAASAARVSAAPARASAPATALARGVSWSDSAPVVVTGYFAGVAIVLTVHAARVVAARRLLRGARPVTDDRVRRLWSRVVAGVRQPPELLECGGLHAPACRTIGGAAVILPSGLDTIDDDTLVACLEHEWTHLRRHDGAVAILAAALTTFLWFQPLVWMFVRALAADREHSCDAIVVRSTRRPRSYAMALLRFCDPNPASRRAAPIIGFESARSIRRRVIMLGYARTSTATSRKALILGLGTAGLLVASAAHAMLVAGAGPGPALMAAARDSSGMSVEVRAPAAGRSDMQVYGRLMRAQAASGGPELPSRFPAVGFGSGVDKSVGVRWPGTWAIDHETVLSAPEARVEEGTLRATRFRLRVPDGSKLRVVVEGRKVVRESDASGVNRLVATGGTIRVVDDAGVTRMRAIAASDRDGATLTLTSTVETGEFTFDLSANDGAIPVSISFDTRTGVPDGERQPPHGAARWKLEAPKDAPGPCELRIQWSYDIEQLQLEGC